jgi:hypothetical protein
MDSAGSGQEQETVSCEYGNELSNSTKYESLLSSLANVIFSKY